eukprot:5997252-Amphidinium_carterae.1
MLLMLRSACAPCVNLVQVYAAGFGLAAAAVAVLVAAGRARFGWEMCIHHGNKVHFMLWSQ